MKKALFSIVTIVMMVFAVSSLTSCSKSETSIVASVESDAIFSSNITPDTRAAFVEATRLMDERLIKIFGKTFNIPCDDEGNVSESTKNSYNNKIKGDKEIQKIFQEMTLLRDIDGDVALYYVSFYFSTGGGTGNIWRYNIALEDN